MSSPLPCRFCGTPLAHTLVDLGRQPLANSYLTAEALAAGTEQSYPLHARVCHACFLVQVDDVVPAEAIFAADYAYFCSYSASWVEHARRYAEAMAERLALGPESLVVEVASNDGYLLQHFVAMDVPVLGVEPAAGTAEAARARGVPTDVAFFNEATAVALAARGVRADLMAANNVLAHVPDISAFVAGFPHVLKPDGVLTFEFPHLLNLIEQVQFDTIYHEHFSYLSLGTVALIFADAGLRVWDVEELPTHGGSLRVYGCHAHDDRQQTAAVTRVLAAEDAAGLRSLATYERFQSRAELLKDDLLVFLIEEKRRGRRVAAYGAAAKGNTFLNFAGVRPDLLRYVCDAAPSKIGKYLPGSHIPILPPSHLREDRPDVVLILPWNIRDEVSAQLAFIREWGGRFATAVPALSVVA